MYVLQYCHQRLSVLHNVLIIPKLFLDLYLVEYFNRTFHVNTNIIRLRIQSLKKNVKMSILLLLLFLFFPWLEKERTLCKTYLMRK